MLKFTFIVVYASCGPTYIESFFTIFGQCINVLNYKVIHMYACTYEGVKNVTTNLDSQSSESVF